MAALASKNVVLEHKLIALQNNYLSAMDDCAAAHKDVKAFPYKSDCRIDLETEVKVLKNEIVELEEGTEAVKEANSKKIRKI